MEVYKFLFLPLSRGSTAFGGEGVLGEPTLEVRAEDKFVYTMPYEEEEDRGCEVKCPKGGGGLLKFLGQLLYYCQKNSIQIRFSSTFECYSCAYGGMYY